MAGSPKREYHLPEGLDDLIDREAFDQILEMDEDDNREFSSGIVLGFLEQAESTFKEMDQAAKEGDLLKLSHLGHFLKGSSATLGIIVVRDECEKIQNLGNHKDKAGLVDEPDTNICLREIRVCLKDAKSGFQLVSAILRDFYRTPDDEE